MRGVTRRETYAWRDRQREGGRKRAFFYFYYILIKETKKNEIGT